jgi:hypothetical protein
MSECNPNEAPWEPEEEPAFVAAVTAAIAPLNQQVAQLQAHFNQQVAQLQARFNQQVAQFGKWQRRFCCVLVVFIVFVFVILFVKQFRVRDCVVAFLLAPVF